MGDTATASATISPTVTTSATASPPATCRATDTSFVRWRTCVSNSFPSLNLLITIHLSVSHHQHKDQQWQIHRIHTEVAHEMIWSSFLVREHLVSQYHNCHACILPHAEF